MANGLLTAADILLKVGVDASGVDAELSSKLARSERIAVASGNRISSSVAKNASQVQAATLRVVAAQERYATVLQREGATQGQIASAQASLINSRRTLARETDKAAISTQRLDQKTSVLGSTVKGFVAGFAGFAAFGFLRTGLQEVKDFQAGVAQTGAGIRSTGGVARVTSEDVQALAGSIQKYSGFTDDSVVAAENLLLTFTKVRNEVGKGNDVFDRATKAAADLQARGFSDLAGSAKQLGKALNDPIAGTGALSRAGVQFTAQQKATIKALVETGDVLSAQKIILREVETQVGGSARAFGETLPGQLERSHRAIEDFSQGTIAALAPALEGLASVATFFNEHKTARDAALFAGGTVGALLLVNKAGKVLATASATALRLTPTRIAANLGIAGSYDKIAVSANRAAAAEGRAATAGLTGGGALRAGASALASPLGIAATLVGGIAIQQSHAISGRRSSLAEKLTDPVEFAKAKTRLAEIDRLAAQANGRPDLFVERTDLAAAIEEARPAARKAAKAAGEEAGRTYRESLKASAEAESFASQALFSGGQRATNIEAARKALADAVRARNDAASSLAEARSGGGGTSASGADIRIAELRLQSARQNLARGTATASEKASVLSAQQRLNDLRSKGKATAEQTAAAEGKVASAIRSQRDAQQRVNEARKALDEARGITAQEALRRIRQDAKAQGTLKADLLKLTGDNASQETLTALKALESQSPGTIHRIAEDSGKRFQREFSDALDRINRRTNAIERLFDGAEDRAARRGRRTAEAFARAFRDTLTEEDLLQEFKSGGGFKPSGGGSTSPATPRRLRASTRQTGGWPSI